MIPHAVPIDDHGNEIVPAYPSAPPLPPVVRVSVTTGEKSLPTPTGSYVIAGDLGGVINRAAVMRYLGERGWPPGLIDQCLLSMDKIPSRFFILDDSGSMNTNDGYKLVPGTQRGMASHVRCTRWDEMGTTVRFHSDLAKAAGCNAEFRFLNGPCVQYPRDIGEGDKLERTLSDSPGGGTPLCAAVRDVQRQIAAMAPALRASGRKAVLTIMTDGEASDGQLAQALQPLQGLPVWMVVRLSTDEDKVVKYWNSLDDELELELDVLDDVVSEAREISEKGNGWLRYCEPLHRLREWGLTAKEFDLLDEQLLTLEQTHKCICLIAGSELASALPQDYLQDFDGYCTAVKRLFAGIPKIHDVLTKRPSTWIDTANLKRRHGKPADCNIS